MSLVRIEIDRNQVNTVRKRYVEAQKRDEYSQKMNVFSHGSKYPKEFEFRLPEGTRFYEEGDYFADLQSITNVDRYGGLSINAFAPIVLYKSPPGYLALYEKLTNELYTKLFNPAPLSAS